MIIINMFYLEYSCTFHLYEYISKFSVVQHFIIYDLLFGTICDFNVNRDHRLDFNDNWHLY